MSINSQNLSRMPKKSYMQGYDEFNQLAQVEEQIREENVKTSSDVKKSSSDIRKSDEHNNKSSDNSKQRSNLQSKLSKKPK